MRKQVTTFWDKNRLYILLSIWALVTISAFQTTFHDLVLLWLKYDESLGHGILVALICIYLFQQNIKSANGAIKPDLYLCVPVVILSLIWGIAYSVGIDIIQQALLPLILLVSLFLLLGKDISRRLIAPILLLYFAVPVWDYLNDTFLSLTTIVVQSAVRITNITAFIEGNSIFLPFGEIAIASGCSGLRYFIVGSFLSILSGYLYFNTLKSRILILTLTIIMTLIANWARVYLVIVIGYVTEMESTIVREHEMLGWILFAIFMSPLFFVNYRYGQTKSHESAEADGSQPIFVKTNDLIPVLLFIFSIYTGPMLVKMQDAMPAEDVKDTISIMNNNKDWLISVAKEDYSLMSKYKNPKQMINQIYERDGLKINLTILNYIKRAESREILPYISKLYDLNIWNQQNITTFKTDIMGDEVIFSQLLLTNKYTSDKRLMLYQFNVGGFNTNDYRIAKLYQIPAHYRGRPQAIITMITIPCEDTCDRSHDLLHAFSDEVLSIFNYFK